MKLPPLLVGVILSSACIVSAAEPAVVRITEDGHYKQRPEWSPDGRQLLFARQKDGTIFLYILSLETGMEHRLTKREEPEYDGKFSPDGKTVAFTFDRTSPNQGDMDVYRIEVDGEGLAPISADSGKPSHDESPCWSPDGTQVAFTSTRDGNQELYVAQSDGKNPRRLTNDPAIDAHPAWSPDGRTIAFATSRWGDLEIALIAADGTNIRRLTRSKGLDDYPAWSSDGKRLAFTSNRDGNFDIFLINTDGRNAVNLTRDPAVDNFPAWTPDGKVGYVSNRDGGSDIYVHVPK